MVGNHHQLARLKRPPHTTRRIRGEIHRRTERVHHANRKRGQGGIVPLVHVKAARHQRHGPTRQRADDELSRMPGDRRGGEPGHVRKRNARCPFHSVGQSAQPRPQHNATHRRLKIRAHALTHVVGGDSRIGGPRRGRRYHDALHAPGRVHACPPNSRLESAPVARPTVSNCAISSSAARRNRMRSANGKNAASNEARASSDRSFNP